MTATQGIWGYGTTLSRDSHVIAEVINFTPPPEARDTIEMTNHQSPSGVKEFIAGVRDSGEVQLDGNFLAGDTDGQIGLRTDMVAGTLQAFVLTFPTAITATFAFNAIVTAFQVGKITQKDKIPFSAKMKISGPAVLSIGASTGLTTPWLSFSAGTIVPAAATAVLEYTLDETTNVSSITITATAAAGVITITANGVSQTVISGNASTAIALGTAPSITNVTISVQETGKVARVYTIHVARAAP